MGRSSWCGHDRRDKPVRSRKCRPRGCVKAYPDYTCGLPSTIGAATEVIRDFFGTDEVPFTVTATALPPAVTRSFTSLSEAADEAASARVYGGIHFRAGCTNAVRLGEKVGRFVFNTQLRPLH